MTLAPTHTGDTPFTGDNPVFELANYCPYLPCGELTSVGTEGRCCGECGSAFNVCGLCRSTNRLLSEFCRGCGQRLESEAWPLEPGLKSTVPRRTPIRALDELRSPFPVRLGAGVQVTPIAADGLLVIAQTDGEVVLLSEHTGERIGRFTVSPPISVTPVLQSGTLFVAAGDHLSAYDLSEFLDQPSLQQLAPTWSFLSPDGGITQPLLVDDTSVYFLTNRGQQAVLYAVSQISGALQWPQPLVLETNLLTPPLLVDNQIILISSAGQVVAAAAATGEAMATFSLNRRVDMQVTPFVMDHRIFFSDSGGYLFELVMNPSGPLINPLYDHRARLTSIAASPQHIALGHMAGLTLLSSRGNFLWTSDSSESVSATPILAGESVFALDDVGNGLLFDTLKSNPVSRIKLLSGEIGMTPLMTHSRIIVVGADGKVVAIDWH